MNMAVLTVFFFFSLPIDAVLGAALGRRLFGRRSRVTERW